METPPLWHATIYKQGDNVLLTSINLVCFVDPLCGNHRAGTLSYINIRYTLPKKSPGVFKYYAAVHTLHNTRGGRRVWSGVIYSYIGGGGVGSSVM